MGSQLIQIDFAQSFSCNCSQSFFRGVPQDSLSDFCRSYYINFNWNTSRKFSTCFPLFFFVFIFQNILQGLSRIFDTEISSAVSTRAFPGISLRTLPKCSPGMRFKICGMPPEISPAISRSFPWRLFSGFFSVFLLRYLWSSSQDFPRSYFRRCYRAYFTESIPEFLAKFSYEFLLSKGFPEVSSEVFYMVSHSEIFKIHCDKVRFKFFSAYPPEKSSQSPF